MRVSINNLYDLLPVKDEDMEELKSFVLPQDLWNVFIDLDARRRFALYARFMIDKPITYSKMAQLWSLHTNTNIISINRWRQIVESADLYFRRRLKYCLDDIDKERLYNLFDIFFKFHDGDH